MSRSEACRYDIPLEQLERSVHVPPDQLITEQGEPPPPPPVSQEETDRLLLLRIASG